jgi:hypothetical protein
MSSVFDIPCLYGGEYGVCRCMRSETSYMPVFPVFDRLSAFSVLGPHPTISEFLAVARQHVGDLTDHVGWVFRVHEYHVELVNDPMCRGLSIAELDQLVRVSYPFWYAAQVVRIGCGPDCVTLQDIRTPLDDGFCYLGLYPMSQWFDLAQKIGPWPTLAHLPGGRFPAVVTEAAVPALKQLEAVQVHCVPTTGFDQLSLCPPTVRVGGGAAAIACRNLGHQRVDVCSSCRTGVPANGRAAGARTCTCPGPSVISRQEMRSRDHLTKVVRGGKLQSDVFLLRDEGPDVSSDHVTLLHDDVYTPAFVHTDPGRVNWVEVKADRWALYLPKGGGIEWRGCVVGSMSRGLVVLGRGHVRMDYRGPDTWVLARGMSECAWFAALHQFLGLDPTDCTARLATAVSAVGFYITPGWAEGVPRSALGPVYVPRGTCKDPGAVVGGSGVLGLSSGTDSDTALQPEPDDDGVVEIAMVGKGSYYDHVDVDGSAVEAIGFPLQVGDDLLLFPGAAVCLLAPGNTPGDVFVCKSLPIANTRSVSLNDPAVAIGLFSAIASPPVETRRPWGAYYHVADALRVRGLPMVVAKKGQLRYKNRGGGAPIGVPYTFAAEF